MAETGSTGRIRIKTTPDGEAPAEIRRAWVELVLPCDPFLGYPDKGMDRGVLTKTEAVRNRYGFSVPQGEAIAILRAANPKAADWWNEHGFPKVGEYFSFAENEAEIVSGVTHQRIIEVRPEMAGDPFR